MLTGLAFITLPLAALMHRFFTGRETDGVVDSAASSPLQADDRRSSSKKKKERKNASKSFYDALRESQA